MRTRFYDRNDQDNTANGTILNSADETHRLLDKFGSDKPKICELECINGYKLTLGLSSDAGFAQYSKSDGDPPYLVAKSDGFIRGNRTFYIDGSESEISEVHCLSADIAKRIAMNFVETGKQSPIVQWEEI